MRLIDRADGVKGHYCIGRLILGSNVYWEFYNKGRWCSAGQVWTEEHVAMNKLSELRGDL